MTKRKPVEELTRAPGYDTTPKPRRAKRGADATEEAKQARVGALLATKNPNDSSTYSPDRPLTEKQKLFVKMWAQGETIASAAYRAGYSDNSSMAYKLVKDPAILKLYRMEKEAYEQASQMSRKKVMDGLLEGVEMAKLAGEPASMINGWKTIGQMCGYFEPIRKKVEITVKGDVTMKHMNKLDDAALLKIIKGEATDVDFKEVSDGEDDGNGDDD